jgi:CBS domain-containing protein
MQVRFIMTLTIESVSPDTSLQEAAQRMKERDVGPLPVCTDDGRLVGMITDRDIAVRATAEGLDPSLTLVRDVMSDDPVYCFEDQDVDEAARLMEENRIRRLAVLDSDRRLVGIVSLGDLAVRASKTQATEVLREVSDPSTGRI